MRKHSNSYCGLSPECANAPIVFFAALLVFVAALDAPGYLAKPDFGVSSKQFSMNLSQCHYAMLMGTGDRIADGAVLFKQSFPFYGILLPLVIGLAERGHQLLSFGQYIKLVQIFEILFLVGSASLYYYFSRRNLFATVLPLLLLSPLVQCGNFTELCITSTPWRIAPFVVIFGTLFAVRRRSWFGSSAVTGSISALCLFLNPETSISCIARSLSLYAHNRASG